MQESTEISEEISLTALPAELRLAIVLIGLRDIIHGNFIFDPYVGVKEYIQNTALISQCFSTFKYTLAREAKIIKKESFALEESSLDQKTKDSAFVKILSAQCSKDEYRINYIESEKKAAALIIGGAHLDLHIPIRGRNYKRTPLCHIAETGRFTQLIPLMVFHGIDTNALIGPYAEPALVIATRNYHVDVVKLLMENGADINAKSVEGWTALTLDESEHGSYGIIAQLIRKSGKLKLEKKEDYCLCILT